MVVLPGMGNFGFTGIIVGPMARKVLPEIVVMLPRFIAILGAAPTIEAMAAPRL